MGDKSQPVPISNVKIPNRVTQAGGQQLEAPDVIENLGSSALTFDRKTQTPRTENVVTDFPWTVSNVKDRSDIPYIVLHEHRNVESAIKRQVLFYGKGFFNTSVTAPGDAISTVANALGADVQQQTSNILSVYDEIFPDNPTNNKYIFPYFTKQYLELNTPNWDDLGSITEDLGKMGSGLSQIASGLGGRGQDISKALNLAQAGGSAALALGETALKGLYPLVGMYDKPRIFSSHSERSLTIEFPLFNTLKPYDWAKNRDLIYKLMSQNLYIKRDYITGFPPCFYRVLVPGQYFSFASCITRVDVQNLGNVRMETGGAKYTGDGYIVPDAWQVSLTLQEMCMPSLNQFQAMLTGDAKRRIDVRARGT